MMAADAITNPDLDRDLEERRKLANDSARQGAPVNGGVRILCGFCNGNGYTDNLQEEQENLVLLTRDINLICNENRKLKEKLRTTDDEKLKLEEKFEAVNGEIKKMNADAEQFLSAIPLGNTQHQDVGVNTISTAEKVKEVNSEKLKWRAKEAGMINLITWQKLKLAGHHSVPKALWGHHTRTKNKAKHPHSNSYHSKPPFYHPKPNFYHPKPNFYHHKPTLYHSQPRPKQTRSYSIPFRPKPLHLLVRKAYLKSVPQPSSKPVGMKETSLVPLVGSLQCDDGDIVFRKLFADALERAVTTAETDHPYYDVDPPDAVADAWASTPFYDSEEQEVPRADNPYYDVDDFSLSPDVTEDIEAHGDHANDEDCNDDHANDEDCNDHPYYEDFDVEAAVEDDDNAPTAKEETLLDLDEETDGDDMQEVSWTEHPYYEVNCESPDAPYENLSALDTEEEDITGSSSLMNEDLYEDEEIPWEDHPYY